eukprot:CAMPEP_0184751690 /NCGR_PEP_ID=MMETSP0315-20130426/43182_1 /TAXON_ID=101924 /ORGANISM="Rhodosorus marinus, Strain UTEX LB 2760" /LENGTH=561 /DNA_ID=CAMNT_0027230973 /DNA_START=174 /DNA_END=1859 /DNA_ORIENTATION=-
MTRWKPSDEQKTWLMREFHENAYPDTATKTRLAAQLRVKRAQVSKWFQHKRESLTKLGHFNPQKQRERRTKEELAVLQQALDRHPYPTAEQIDDVLRRTRGSMTAAQVKLWFKHKRNLLAKRGELELKSQKRAPRPFNSEEIAVIRGALVVMPSMDAASMDKLAKYLRVHRTAIKHWIQQQKVGKEGSSTGDGLGSSNIGKSSPDRRAGRMHTIDGSDPAASLSERLGARQPDLSIPEISSRKSTDDRDGEDSLYFSSLTPELPQDQPGLQVGGDHTKSQEDVAVLNGRKGWKRSAEEVSREHSNIVGGEKYKQDHRKHHEWKQSGSRKPLSSGPTVDTFQSAFRRQGLSGLGRFPQPQLEELVTEDKHAKGSRLPLSQIFHAQSLADESRGNGKPVEATPESDLSRRSVNGMHGKYALPAGRAEPVLGGNILKSARLHCGGGGGFGSFGSSLSAQHSLKPTQGGNTNSLGPGSGLSQTPILSGIHASSGAENASNPLGAEAPPIMDVGAGIALEAIHNDIAAQPLSDLTQVPPDQKWLHLLDGTSDAGTGPAYPSVGWLL